MKKNFFLSFFLLLFFSGCSDDPKKKSPTDPLYAYQWYLQNTGQTAGATNGGTIGEDIRLGNTWLYSTGRDVTVGIVDTGIERAHPDLSGNVDSNLSATYYNGMVVSTDPTPAQGAPTYQLDIDPVYSAHGTACAGIAAAVFDNDIGIKGIAPRATLAGLNAFADLNSSTQFISFADALYNAARPVDVSSNSWTDFPGVLSDSSEELISIREGIAQGRNGKGVIYCFAAGNQRASGENSNWYRELNTPFVITVAALDANGRYASYSNFGANVLISAYGGYSNSLYPRVVTTDLGGIYGFDDPQGSGHFDAPGNETGAYTNTLSGTSFSTPMISGIAALLLEANPALTYRDVRYILATTARQNDPDNTDWTQNGAGRWVNHNYGFGAVDTAAAVARAMDYTLLEDNLTRSYDSGNIAIAVSGTQSAEENITVTDPLTLEHVELWVQLAHDNPGDLEITLTSPAGTASRLSHPNIFLNSSSAYDGFFYDYLSHDGFTFGSVRYLDENAGGTWKLNISSTASAGTLYHYKLILHGRLP